MVELIRFVSQQQNKMIDYTEVEFALVSLGNKDYSSQILKDLHPKDLVSDGIDVWHLTNKYFHADVKLCCCGLHEFHQNFKKFDKIEAVLILFEFESNDSLNKLKGLNDHFNSENPDLRLLWEVSNVTLKDKDREDIMSWCLDNQFEFVENEEEEENAEELEEAGDLKDKYGSERILEALRSHMWRNHRMKETDEGSANVQNSEDSLSSQLEEQLLQRGESFEELFGKLQAMKEQAQGLEGEARKDYAEKVAYAFMEALGIDDDTDEEPSEDR